MATFNDSEAGSSVRSKINAAITTVDGLGTGDNLLLTAAEQAKLTGIETSATNNTGALADLNTVNTAQIDDDAVTIAKLAATGTASATTFLRGDNTWAVPAGGGGISWSTPVDADIIPDGPGTRNIGSIAANIGTIRAQTLVLGGETLTALADPGATKIILWNDALNTTDFLELGSGLTLTGLTLSADAVSGIADVVDDTTPQLGGNLDGQGNQIANYVNAVLPATGTLDAATHSGNMLTTTGNVIVPTVAGFTCIIIAGGAHTVTFNGTTSAAMAAGDLMTVAVESGTIIHAVLTAAADKVSFT